MGVNLRVSSHNAGVRKPTCCSSHTSSKPEHLDFLGSFKCDGGLLLAWFLCPSQPALDFRLEHQEADASDTIPQGQIQDYAVKITTQESSLLVA